MNASLSHWLKAFRLRTLPLALSSILMGTFLALASGEFHWGIFLLSILTTILLQILSNLANDYGDSIHGADSAARKGPGRAVQSGHISANSMKVAVVLFAVLALLSGSSLLFVAFGLNWNAILFFLALGILCILAAIAYTMGRKPYGYAGLGDLSVLVFFGFVGVLGSLYLFTQRVGYLEVLPALSCGVFSIGVLNINNIRDIESDRLAGKYSVPVRIGRANAIIYHWFLIVTGITAAIIYTILSYQTPWQWVFLVSVPLFAANAIAVSKKPSADLDPYLKQMALSTLVFVVTFGLGLILA